jgi:nucleotide-binding universal stress UspA family protein
MIEKLNELILVPTDFSDICQNAVDHGAELARYLNYKLVVMHVINKETKSKLKKENLDKETIQKDLTEIANSVHERYEIETDFRIREGSIFTEIHQAATELGANLMVLGTHGKKGLQHVFGSFALKVVAKSPVPTIVVQEESIKRSYDKIIFPINDFTEARQQVTWSMNMAKIFNSEVLIFQQLPKEFDVAKKINVVTKQIEEAFRNNDIKYQINASDKTANFGRQLIDYATTNNADLIVMMTSPDIFSPDFKSSQWSESLMFNQGKVPVMCINPVETGQVHYQYYTLL